MFGTPAFSLPLALPSLSSQSQTASCRCRASAREPAPVDDSTAEQGPKPRRRGRPPKQKTALEASPATITAQPVSVAVNRRRGRPRKEASSASDVVIATKAGAPKRRRGRPRKEVSAPLGGPVHPKPDPPKRRKGRPPTKACSSREDVTLELSGISHQNQPDGSLGSGEVDTSTRLSQSGVQRTGPASDAPLVSPLPQTKRRRGRPPKRKASLSDPSTFPTELGPSVEMKKSQGKFPYETEFYSPPQASHPYEMDGSRLRRRGAGGPADETPLERIPSIIGAADGLNPGEGEGGNGPRKDFVEELMPLLANADLQAAAEASLSNMTESLTIEEPLLDISGMSPSEATAAMRLNAGKLRNQYASMFRFSGSYNSLLPFQLRSEKTAICETCSGSGSMTCEYCRGVGTVPESLCGPPGSVVESNGKSAVVPDDASMLEECICAFCGGLSLELCVRCDGEGKLDVESDGRDLEERKGTGKPSAAADSVFRPATTAPDKAEFIRQHADRIEIGVDGTVILRAKPVRKGKHVNSKDRAGNVEESTGGGKRSNKVTNAAASKRKTAKDKNVDPVDVPGKRKRGRPRKDRNDDLQRKTTFDAKDNAPPNVASSSGGLGLVTGGRGAVGKSTDFLNTEYKVLRENRIAWFRKNAAAFSEELTKQQEAGSDEGKAEEEAYWEGRFQDRDGDDVV